MANPEPSVRESAGKVREKCGKDLTGTELAVAEYIEARVVATTREVMGRFSFSERGAQGVLRRLIDKGVVEKVGAGRSTRYRIAG